MDNILTALFGDGSNLSTPQMVLRGVAVFALTLLMIRISGRRSFGQHTPFDACITVLLGSILSRAVVGASPFLPTIGTGVALVLLHRAFAMLSVRAPFFEALISGRPRTLVLDGKVIATATRKGLVSQADLLQALHEQVHSNELEQVHKMTLERDGTISVVQRPGK
jgi:uncharacterized membrane protein YcaP (DUF421 family)